jgi:peptidoglycan/xylan/chitin deacetylase (PgdA/CDA1 family)
MSIKRSAVRFLLRTPVPEALTRWRSRNVLTVLAYHRIGAEPDHAFRYDSELISSTPDEFLRELQFLRRNFDVLSMREFVDGLAQPKTLPLRPALITFDDGYRDNYDVALPVLRGAGLPATFFVATRIVGTSSIPWWDAISCAMKYSRADSIPSPFPADPARFSLDARHRQASIRRFLGHMKNTRWSEALAALEKLKADTQVDPAACGEDRLFMSWDEVRELKKAGMDIGAHTRTHPIVANLDGEAELMDEIDGSYHDITKELHQPPLAFAYPVGSTSAMSASADSRLRSAGFSVAFSYVHTRLLASHVSDPFRIPRLHSEYLDDYDNFRIGMARAPRV